mgnify:CR=1 FL=1
MVVSANPGCSMHLAAAGIEVRHPLELVAEHIIAPHLGSATRKTRIGMVERTIENMMAGLTGKPLPSAV